jgi:hypothetical protein
MLLCFMKNTKVCYAKIYRKRVLYKGHCVDEPTVSQPQTGERLSRTCGYDFRGQDWISVMNLSTWNALLAFILDTAVAWVNALVRLCVTTVAQPLDGWDTARPQWLSPSRFVSHLNSLAIWETEGLVWRPGDHVQGISFPCHAQSQPEHTS